MPLSNKEKSALGIPLGLVTALYVCAGLGSFIESTPDGIQLCLVPFYIIWRLLFGYFMACVFVAVIWAILILAIRVFSRKKKLNEA